MAFLFSNFPRLTWHVIARDSMLQWSQWNCIILSGLPRGSLLPRDTGKFKKKHCNLWLRGRKTRNSSEFSTRSAPRASRVNINRGTLKNVRGSISSSALFRARAIYFFSWRNTICQWKPEWKRNFLHWWKRTFFAVNFPISTILSSSP